MKAVAITAALVFGLGIIQVSHAQETSASKLKIEEALRNRKFREDGRITDIELKAQAGSLSRYSLKFDMAYSGPPVDNLSDAEMPNPDNRPRPNRTSLGGFMGLRYRMNSSSALNFSTGLRWFSPYHQMAGDHVNKRRGDKDYEISNPQISYDRTYPLGATQMRSSIKGSMTTSDYYLDRGQQGSLGLVQAVKYSVPDTRWILGTVADADYYFFERGFRASDGRMSQYYLSLIPSIEYKLVDNLNLRTSVAFSFANLRMADDSWIWEEQVPSGRFGLGWAITRDIYFSPYLSFFTDSPAIRTTSLSFSTVFSIF